jgi:hypothetical protein
VSTPPGAVSPGSGRRATPGPADGDPAGGDRAAAADGDGDLDEDRAARLLRWYPRAWRDRYGDEFAELLLSDMAERPRSLSRTLDVARGGIVARLANAGLCGSPVAAAADATGGLASAASLAALTGCLAIFVVVGAAMWSQLTVGWQWSAPAGTATLAAMVAMSVAMMAFTALALLAIAPVAWMVVIRLARGAGRRGVLVPSVVFLGCLAVLFIGGRHFGNGWPGTGGHPWAGGFVRLGGREWIGRGLVPGGFAAFSWAATLSVTTYWGHPTALAGFPAAEIAWMAVSPLALVGAIWAAATAVRRACLPIRVLAFQARLAALAVLAMFLFFIGCACWVASGGQGLYHAGTIDALGVGFLAVVLAVAGPAARRTRRFISR